MKGRTQRRYVDIQVKEDSMKLLYTIVVALVMTACSTHQVRCRGVLRPINKPAVASKPPGSKPTASTNPVRSGGSSGSAVRPDAAPATSAAEPRP
jgi:hypothetical protein